MSTRQLVNTKELSRNGEFFGSRISGCQQAHYSRRGIVVGECTGSHDDENQVAADQALPKAVIATSDAYRQWLIQQEALHGPSSKWPQSSCRRLILKPGD